MFKMNSYHCASLACNCVLTSQKVRTDILHIMNPQRMCAVRVTVLCLCGVGLMSYFSYTVSYLFMFKQWLLHNTEQTLIRTDFPMNASFKGYGVF